MKFAEEVFYMFKLLLVEDDITQLIALKNILNELLPGSHIDTADTYNEAVRFIKEISDYDIFYLDIALSDKKDTTDGLSIGQLIRSLDTYKHTPIIFVTSFTDKINEAINRLHCYSYLVKPYTYEDVENSLKDILDSDLIKEKPIIFKNNEGINFKLLPSDITQISSENHGILVFTDSYRFNTRHFSLDSVLAELPNYFVRCHRKHIVNINKILNYDRSMSMLHTKTSALPVGRIYKTDFEERFIRR